MFLTSSMVASGGASVATTSIVNSYSSNGAAGSTLSFSNNRGTKQTLSGSMTNGVLKQILNITGSSGSMSQLAIATNDATARTIRVKITIDGNATPAFDATSASISTTSNGVIVIGFVDTSGTNLLVDGYPMKWKTSCLVEAASSVTETDKFTIGHKYYLES